ncbi:SH3 domain-containing protein [Ferruginivarius sediminum]|nr:SH3 domain-containing protein [Ferruginivarius sediminum]
MMTFQAKESGRLAVFRPALVLAVACLLLSMSGAALAQQTGRSTGLPIPRFVSLRADEVNLRTGPGLRYPIEWVYRRQDLPVEVIEEFEAWRRIRGWDGTVGWVHGVMLQSKRTARVTGSDIRLLRARANPDGDPVAMLEPGAIGKLDRCKRDWCRIEFAGLIGWLQRKAFYGVLPGETLD